MIKTSTSAKPRDSDWRYQKTESLPYGLVMHRACQPGDMAARCFSGKIQTLNATPGALDDGDMAQEDATVTGELLARNVANPAPGNLKAAVSEIATACSMLK